jgi:hypothetical protein
MSSRLYIRSPIQLTGSVALAEWRAAPVAIEPKPDPDRLDFVEQTLISLYYKVKPEKGVLHADAQQRSG